MGRSAIVDLVNVAVRDVWGEAITYTPSSTGVAESLTVVYDSAAQVVELQGDVPISTYQPRIDVRLDDLTVMPRGRSSNGTADTCEIRGLTYAVVRVEPTGNGCAKCYLVRA